MTQYVDLSERVTATFYDDEHEEWTARTKTVADILDKVCDDYTTFSPQEIKLEWTLCSPDSMPEDTDDVLVTYIVNGNKKKRYVGVSTWHGDYDNGYWSSSWDDYLKPGTIITIIAWTPMPKPYMK